MPVPSGRSGLDKNASPGAGQVPNGQRKLAGVWRAAWQFPLTRIVAFAAMLGTLLWVVNDTVENAAVRYPAMAVAAVMMLRVMGRFENRTLAEYGFNSPKVALRDIVLGFVVGGAAMSAIVGLMAYHGWYRWHPQHLTSAVVASLAASLWMYLAIAVTEETVYRGYFLQTLERRWGSDIAFAATMVTFGLAHLMVNVPGATLSLRLIGALSIGMEAGILFAAAYLATRRLWMPIGIHWAWNFFEGPVFGTPVTGANFNAPILSGRVHGPSWATGGGFGPEASLPALLVGTGLGLVLLAIALNRKRHVHPARHEE